MSTGLTTQSSEALVRIPPHAWRRWLERAYALSHRNPLAGLVVYGIALLWAIVAGTIAEGARDLGLDATFYVRWVLLVLGSTHAIAVGVALARAADESTPFVSAISSALSPRTACRAICAGFPYVAAVLVAGAAAHQHFSFGLNYSSSSGLRALVADFPDASVLDRVTLFARAIASIALGMSATLLPAVAGLYIALTNFFGIAALPTAVAGGTTGGSLNPLRTAHRSLAAAWANTGSAGAGWLGWVLSPAIGAGLLWAYTALPGVVGPGVFAMAATLLLFWQLPPLLYVANRELFDNAFSNLPKGFLPTSGALIEGEHLWRL